MMRALGPVQPGWGNPNRGRHTISPYDPMERRRDPRVPSADKPAGQGKGTGASPTHGGVARSKAAVTILVQVRVQGDGAPSSTATVAWGSNRLKQDKDRIDKSIARRLT
jgi:hypothetical protein